MAMCDKPGNNAPRPTQDIPKTSLEDAALIAECHRQSLAADRADADHPDLDEFLDDALADLLMDE